MAWKEVIHIRRDIRTLYMALGLPVVMLLLFGYGVSFDIRSIPLLISDLDRTPESRDMVATFLSGGEFVYADESSHPSSTEEALRSGRARASLILPEGLSHRLAKGENVGIQFVIDGSDGTTAAQALGKADAIARSLSQKARKEAGFTGTPPLGVSLWTRFNPEARSALYLVPGLIAYILAMVSVMLTALTVAREWEKGSMEQLFCTPVGRLEIILGKLAPYLGLGIIQVLLVLAVGAWQFSVPLRGSLPALGVMSVLFMMGMLGQGLLISVVTRNQLVATQMGMLSSMLPSMLLSGFIIPIQNMPVPLQVISNVIPARYLIAGLRGVLLKGNGFAEVWGDILALFLFAALILTIATARFQRRIA